MQDPAAIFSQMNGRNPQFPEPEHLKCPRCDSPNTKFCYYNNYNLSQPRHFCKNCRRYWTKGGVLRNIPVGGGSRKNSSSKRTTTKSSSSSSAVPLSTSSSSSSPPPAAQPPPPSKSEPYNLMMLLNAPSLDQDRRILDLSGGGSGRSFISSLSEPNNDEGHFGHLFKDGLICDGSNLIDHGPNQSSVQAQDSSNGGPLEGSYRPSCWTGSNASWPDHLAMYTPEASTNYQQFIEFPPTNTRDS